MRKIRSRDVARGCEATVCILFWALHGLFSGVVIMGRLIDKSNSYGVTGGYVVYDLFCAIECCR